MFGVRSCILLIQLRPLDYIKSSSLDVLAVELFNSLYRYNTLPLWPRVLGRDAVRLRLFPPHLFPQPPDLQFQLFVFPHLPSEKVVGHPALLLDAPGSQTIQIRYFIAGFLEVLHLDKALPDQGVDDEVHLAEADPQT